MLLYVHIRLVRTATSTLTQLLKYKQSHNTYLINYANIKQVIVKQRIK